MANKPPAFQFYVNDWLSSSNVAMMTPEQRGCYIQLLARSWPDGIPYDAHASSMLWALASMPSADAWDKIKAPIMAQFVERDGRLINLKLEDQFKSMASYHTMTAERAKKAADSRWGKKDASSMPQALLGDASSSSSSTASSTDNSTVQSGTVRSDHTDEDLETRSKAKSEATPKAKPSVPKIQGKISVKPAVPPSAEEQDALEGLSSQWRFYKLPESEADGPVWTDLIRKHGGPVYDDLVIPDVMAWMMFINNDGYWKGRIHSVKDFARCYPTMHEQYLKCGGDELEEALLVAGRKYASDLAQSTGGPDRIGLCHEECLHKDGAETLHHPDCPNGTFEVLPLSEEELSSAGVSDTEGL